MENWQVGDIVAYEFEGMACTGLVEGVEDGKYTLRMMALDEEGQPSIVTDTVHTVDKVDELEEAVEDYLEEDDDEEKAEPSDLSEGDWVRWDSAGGTAQGRITGVHTETWTVPDTDFTLEASDERPAFEIEVYDRTEGGWVASGVIVGHYADTLERIDPLDTVEKRYPRFFDKLKNVTTEEDGTTGHVKGYLSVAGNVDLGGDVVMKGAFKQTLFHNDGKTTFMLDHGWKTEEVIGVLYLEEDEKGLKMDGAINLNTPQGKMAYETAKFQIEHGRPMGASIGYGIVKSAPNPYGGLDLHEVKLYEGSITPFPMNESALITEAKRKYDRKNRKHRAERLMTKRSGIRPTGGGNTSGDNSNNKKGNTHV
jgi:uncharacterized protein